MKNIEKQILLVNDLLRFNYEAEKFYLDAFSIVSDVSLKIFFKNTSFYRNKFCKALRSEIINHGGTPVVFENTSIKLNRSLMRLKHSVNTENKVGLIDEICNVKQQTIFAYNNLLQQRNLPLSICKVLVEQRDKIQETLNTIQAKKQLVA